MGDLGGRAKAKSVSDVVVAMGRERRELRARKATVVMLQFCSLVCLLSALASFVGYLPHSVGAAAMLLIAASAGFVLSVLEARKT